MCIRDRSYGRPLQFLMDLNEITIALPSTLDRSDNLVTDKPTYYNGLISSMKTYLLFTKKWNHCISNAINDSVAVKRCYQLCEDLEKSYNDNLPSFLRTNIKDEPLSSLKPNKFPDDNPWLAFTKYLLLWRQYSLTIYIMRRLFLRLNNSCLLYTS